MKVLITGAGGLYGTKLAQLCLEQGLEVYNVDNQMVNTSENNLKMDITNNSLVNEGFLKVKPDIVVHAASLTDVDKCETNKDLAWKVNVEGTKNIVDASKRQKAFIIYISTDYVFNGEKGNYKETDSPDPINYYGLTKLEAEKVVWNSSIDYCIIRPSVIYGSIPAAGKVNFVLWILDNLKKQQKIRIIDDQWNTPTLNTNLAKMTIEVMNRRLTGLFHLCGATRVNRLEFAQAVATIFNYDNSLIEAVKTADFTWPAKRPKDSSLDTAKAQQLLNCQPLKLIKALKLLKEEMNEKEKNTD